MWQKSTKSQNHFKKRLQNLILRTWVKEKETSEGKVNKRQCAIENVARVHRTRWTFEWNYFLVNLIRFEFNFAIQINKVKFRLLRTSRTAWFDWLSALTRSFIHWCMARRYMYVVCWADCTCCHPFTEEPGNKRWSQPIHRNQESSDEFKIFKMFV